VIGDGRIHPKKRVSADRYETGHHAVRRHEAVTANRGVMTDVIAAPEDDVVAERHEGLDGVVLEDEAVLPELDVPPHERPTAHIRGRRVALGLRLAVQPLAKRVVLRVDNRRIEAVMLRGKPGFDVLEVHHWPPAQALSLPKGPFNRESDDLV